MPVLTLQLAAHPSLRVGTFSASFDAPLGELPTTVAVRQALALDAVAPLARDESVRAAVRDMLRHGGYKPTGRGKPASEYLVRAATEGALASINLAVDACNAVSLHSGFPISVVDLDRTTLPLHVRIAPPGTRYVFNASGQEIDLGGLVALFDAHGACANAVRDAQRTKTSTGTRRTLSIVWGCAGFEERLAATVAWYQRLLAEGGAAIEAVDVAESSTLT